MKRHGPAPTFQKKDFSVSTTTQSMSQEASALGIKPGELPYGQLYITWPDVGLRLASNPILATEYETWIFLHEDRCGDEVQGWRFAPSAETVRMHPELEGYDLLIIND